MRPHSSAITLNRRVRPTSKEVLTRNARVRPEEDVAQPGPGSPGSSPASPKSDSPKPGEGLRIDAVMAADRILHATSKVSIPQDGSFIGHRISST